MLKVGFIGLGNVGGKLAGSLLRNGVDLTVRDLDRAVAQPFIDGGADWAACRARRRARRSWKPRTAYSRGFPPARSGLK